MFTTFEVSNPNPFNVLNSVENDVDLGTNGGTSNLASKEANSSGSSFWNVGSSSTSTTPIVENIDKFERLIIDGKFTLVDDEGKPVEKVVLSGDHDSEDEVEPIDNEMASFLTSKKHRDLACVIRYLEECEFAMLRLRRTDFVYSISNVRCRCALEKTRGKSSYRSLSISRRCKGRVLTMLCKDTYALGFVMVERVMFNKVMKNECLAQAKRLFRHENVWVEMHRGIARDKVENLNPQSTPQVFPSFEEYTPPVNYPKEVEPLHETPLEDLGLNTCNHEIPFSSKEIPSFDEPEPQPQPFPSFLSLEVDLGEERGPEPPIKPPSPDSFRMKEVDHLTNHTPPSPYVASFHPKDTYCYYHPCIGDPKKHYGFKPGLLGQKGSIGVDFSNLEMIENDWELESKEVSFLGRGLNSPVRPKEVEKERGDGVASTKRRRRDLSIDGVRKLTTASGLAGHGVTSIKRCHRDQSTDGVRIMVTASGCGRLKEDLESSTWRWRQEHKAMPLRTPHQVFGAAAEEYRRIQIQSSLGLLTRFLSRSTFVGETLRKSDQLHQTFKKSSIAMARKLYDMIEFPKSQPKRTYNEDLECEIVMVKMPKCMAWLDDELIGDLDTMDDKVKNPIPQSTP
ncbi:hypothetical protein Tco_0757115 [Tanacetum coccineum]